MGVPSPVNDDAVRFRTRFELFQIVSQVRECVLLNLRRQVAQRLPLRYLTGSLITPHTSAPQNLVEPLFVNWISEELPGFQSLIDGFHADTPFRTSAIWRNVASCFTLPAQPSRCIRQDMSDDTINRAPPLAIKRILS